MGCRDGVCSKLTKHFNFILNYFYFISHVSSTVVILSLMLVYRRTLKILRYSEEQLSLWMEPIHLRPCFHIGGKCMNREYLAGMIQNSKLKCFSKIEMAALAEVETRSSSSHGISFSFNKFDASCSICLLFFISLIVCCFSLLLSFFSAHSSTIRLT